MARPSSWFVAAVLALVALPGAVAAQCVSLTTLGSAYTQNFDTLSNVAGSTTNNLTIPGWFMTESGGGARDNEQYAVDTGGSTTGDTYSYGAAGSTERALGGLRSGTLIPLFGACFTNDTGATIGSLAVAYTGEEWRFGTVGRTDQISFEYSTNATDLVTGTWTAVAALAFVTPDTVTTGAKNGNAAADRTALSSTIPLAIANGATFWIRWTDADVSGADDGLAVDDFSLTPSGAGPVPSLTINDVAQNEGDSGTTTFTFTVSLSAPAGPGGVTFDIATADGTATAPGDYASKSLTGQAIPVGSSTYTFDVLVNGDTAPESDETFFVNVTNVTGASVGDGQGQGTVVNDDLSKIHDVQGNGASTPMPGSTAIVEGVVTANFQGTSKLQGFFLQEEDADADADPATSEGIFVFCGTCPTPVAEGQRVRARGTVSEFNGMTEITASTAGAVIVTDPGNHLAEVTPTPISLPIVGDLDAFYEAREGMLVTFTDTLSVAEYFQLARFGQIVLTQGGRPFQFTEQSTPSVAGFAAHEDAVARREIILDDDNNAQEAYLNLPDGSQFVLYPQANGGFSVGTQGVDYFRGGDLVSGLTGVLHWSFPGSGPETWRIRPTAAHPVVFTVANPRPATPPSVGGAIKAVGMNLLNYFTTIDTTASNTTGTCGPAQDQDCRGADSVAELNRQRERASIVVCTLNADVYAFMELENTTPSDTITDLLGAVNARCGGAHPFAFVDTGGTLGTDAIRVEIVYRTGILSPVGSPLVDLDPIHNRPPTAQTFDVVDAASPVFGARFTVIANHLKSKGCDAAATGADADALDGQSCYAGRRTAQATRLLTWLNGTVLPAAGAPDVLLLGDFNSYAQETPVTTLEAGAFTDLEAALDPGVYSYLFSAELGHLDYAFASASLAPKVTGAAPWHVNADEVDLFDYNDEVRDAGEATFEEKPDGSALVPPRVVFAPGSPYRASDHDPVLVGLFAVADLAVTKTDTPDPVVAGANLGYTITLTNNGPDTAASVSLTDTLPAGTTFVSLASPGGWSCTTPAVGAGGTVSCSEPSLAVGSAVFTLTVAVDAAVAGGTVLSNAATASSTTAEGHPGDESGIATTTVEAPPAITSADHATLTEGSAVGFTITTAGYPVPGVSADGPLPSGVTLIDHGDGSATLGGPPALGTRGTYPLTIHAANGIGSEATQPFTLTIESSALDFHTLAPCRLLDTRQPGPAAGRLTADEVRTLVLAGTCGVPGSARALQLNVTAVAASAGGQLVLYRGDLASPPGTSALSFGGGQTRAGNLVVELSFDGFGTIRVHNVSTGDVHLLLDVSGYFQ